MDANVMRIFNPALTNLVPRARVTLVQRNGNEGLWDKAFQIAVSLVENLSMRSRTSGQISFPETALPLWAPISSPEFLRLFVSGWSPE